MFFGFVLKTQKKIGLNGPAQQMSFGRMNTFFGGKCKAFFGFGRKFEHLRKMSHEKSIKNLNENEDLD